jgi:hypothetical protein
MNCAAAFVRPRLDDPPIDAALAPATVPPEIEQRIGDMVADAAIAVVAGVMDWEAQGKLAPATRARAGDLFVRMYELQEEVRLSSGIDFAAVAATGGKRTIMRRYGVVLAEHYGAATLDAALDQMLSWPLGTMNGQRQCLRRAN